jgi:tRNA pseudouridine38-40 synthase
VSGAGRTDAGVHAREQVAGFRLDPTLPNREFFKALNAVLPPDIRITSLVIAPAGFHPRRSARSKVYVYRILNAPRVDPFRLRYVLHWPHRLDIRAMRKAAALFAREADFSAFSSNRELHPVGPSSAPGSPRRDRPQRQANGFLRYMATIADPARGRAQKFSEKVEELFREKGRTLHSLTAPPAASPDEGILRAEKDNHQRPRGFV